MVGLRELADTADAELPQGFENVLASVMHAHPDGLQRPASACRGTRSTPARPAAATTAARKQVRPPAGGATRKAREAREPLATYLFGDKCEAPVGAHDRAFERRSDLWL